MAAQLTIEFHHTHPLEPVEFHIRRELASLEKFYDRFQSCRVDVEAPEHKHRGGVFNVHIDFGLPPEDATAWARLNGVEFQDSAEHMKVAARQKDAAMAVHAAFRTARRRLKDFVNVSSK